MAETSFKDKYYEMLRKELFDYQLISFYKKELNNKNRQNDDISKHLSYLENENNILNIKYNRKIYRIAGVFQKVVDKLIPLGSKRRHLLLKVYSMTKGFFKLIFKLLKKTIKSVYSILLPKNIRRKVNHKIHSSEKMSKLLHVTYYPSLPRRKCVTDNEDCILLNNKTWANGKIAVHVHMYYVDLTDEFVNYLKNIPYKFDLYISTKRKKDMPVMYLKLRNITNADKIVIKESKNSGRNFGPMFVLFGRDLKKYDYLLHIHTKKSLRAGFEQTGWRKYLLDGLLGSRELVMQYFDLMDNHSVGLAYPSTYTDVRLFAYSWLLNYGIAKKYFEKCGYEIKEEYLNFSAGSMFWCKTDAIKQLFDLNLEWEDFGVEEGKDEGTIAHAFERIFGVANKYNKYNFATFGNDNIFHINDDDYGLKEYTEKYLNETFDILKNYKTITFNIFDTLVTRKVYEPEDVFELVDEKVSHTFNIAKGEYKSNRKKAEENLRKKNNYVGDVDINEIYEEFGKLLNISAELSNQIKEVEIETDISLIIPRKDMLVLYNKLKSMNKELIMIADMYYTREIIEKILCKCGYLGYCDILLSSETGFRKDNGTMWEYFYNKYPNINSIHVGDNDVSDMFVNIKLDKPSYHILNGKKIYELSKLNAGSKNILDNRIIKGLLVNKVLFNSPFNLQENKGVRIDDLKSCGYCLLGPVIFTYLQWLIKNIDKNYNLLFVSREGYFLQKIYNLILDEYSKYHKNANYYFLISKRAISVPTIETLSDIEEILSLKYEGSLKELIFNRLGYILPDNIENKFVNSPGDLDEIISFIEPFKDEIINNAGIEKKNYLKYINSLNLDKDNKNCIVDLGYSGTSQYYLAKLLKENIDGAYFLTRDKLKSLSLNDKVFSCYNDTNYNGSFSEHAIGKYHLFLEAFLTSDSGQLIKFDENTEPVYLNSVNNNMDKLTEIYEGISEFISDLREISNIDILDLDIDKEYIGNQFGKIIKYCTFSKEIIDTWKVEDLYSSNSDELNIEWVKNHA